MKKNSSFADPVFIILCCSLLFPGIFIPSVNCYAQSIACGDDHSLFLCGDGTVLSCGQNSFGQLGNANSFAWENPPIQLDSLSGITKVADGSASVLFLKNDGTVWSSGYNISGTLGNNSNVNSYSPVLVSNLTGITSVSAGNGNSFFMKNDTLWGCGGNYHGCLGDGTFFDRWTPVQITAVTGIVSVAGGFAHTLFLKNDSTVWGCGYNNSGQLGDGITTDRNLPFQITGLSGITAVAAGVFYHSLFLKSDSTVWACGSNGNGQLGDGTTTDRDTVVQVNGINGITAIAAGNDFSLFLKSDSTVWACGWNAQGQLGDSTYTNKTTPVQVAGITGIIAIAAGESHSLFLKYDGTVWACGNNDFGQLGNGNFTKSNVPIQITGLTGITSISAGGVRSHFIKNNSTVWACGSNQYGELGSSKISFRVTAVPVSFINQVKAVASGKYHSLFLKNDGTVWACGDNSYGQLGDSTIVQRRIPVEVIGLTGIIAVASGQYHSLFIKNDGTVWACGYNSWGELGDGTNVDRSIPVQVTGLTGIIAASAGYSHSLFLKNDGTVWACGLNGDGQLGDGTNFTRFTPVQVGSLSGIVAVAAGGYHSLFLQNDGTVWTSGNNAYGQLGNGTTTDHFTPMLATTPPGITAIAAGAFYSIFLRTNGTVWGCGNNSSGQLGTGTLSSTYVPAQAIGLSGITDMAACSGHSLFIRNDSTVWASGDESNGQLGNGVGMIGMVMQTMVPVLVPNLCSVIPSIIHLPHTIHGFLFADSTHDCIMQTMEQHMPFFPVTAMPGPNYAFSNDTGFYSVGVNNFINYTVTPLIPQRYSHMIQNPCPANYPVFMNANSASDTSGFDFGFDVNPCYQLRVSVGGDRKRRCFYSRTILYYWNEGLAAVDSATIHVKFSQYDIPVSATLPFTLDSTDGSLVFNIGALNAGQNGNLTIYDSIACTAGISGLTQCTKAWILPPNYCLIDSTTGSGWDHSSISVGAMCSNDTIHFVIYNTGNNMATASQYRIYSNNNLTQTVSFQLTSGDSLVVVFVSGGATIRLEADQNAGHPGHSHPRATVEACGTNGSGTFSIGQLNLAPQDDEDVDVEINCMQIRESYDPNEKINAPEGIDAAHVILPNTPIDFTIHFQNTGTDTAYKVIITDSLSNDLDLATLEPGAASHPYSLLMSGQGVAVLKFTFNAINLVDSFTNEPASSGFVKYRITPKTNTPLGTVINNAADIYFDYNQSVRTNTAFVTLGNYLILSNNNTKTSKAGDIIFYPNPTTNFLTLETGRENMLEQVIVYSMDGRKIKEENPPARSDKVEISLGSLARGMYFLDCISKNGGQKIRVVKY